MLFRVTLIISLLMTGFAVAESCEPEREAESQFLTVKLYEQGEPKKVLVESTLQVPQNGVLNDVSGGTLPPVRGEAALKVGVRVTGTIKPADQGRFRIALKLQVGNRVESQDPQTQVVKSQSIEIRSDLKPGESKLIHCGGDQWLEVELD